MKKIERGFTIVEMLVIAPIVVLAIGSFILIVVSLTGEALSSRAKNAIAHDIQGTLRSIELDANRASGFLATTNVTINTPQGQNDSTTHFLNTHTTYGTALILDQVATTDNPLNTFIPVRVKDEPYACNNPFVNQNSSLTINIVYFIKDNSLWRRTILPSNYKTAACSTPWQRPSCTPEYSASFCETNDTLLVSGVSTVSFSTDYYTSQSLTTSLPIASDPSQSTANRTTALNTARVVKVTIQATQTVAGRDIQWQASRLIILR